MFLVMARGRWSGTRYVLIRSQQTWRKDRQLLVGPRDPNRLPKRGFAEDLQELWTRSQRSYSERAIDKMPQRLCFRHNDYFL
eukprot:s5657_g1.t3